MSIVPKPLKESVGLAEVELVFLRDFGWAFRHQPVLDWGIDAHVEVMEGDQLIGKLIALQIKSGPSYFRKKGDGFVYYGEKRHYDYWLNHSLPVFIILHRPADNLILWQKFEARLCTVTESGWSIDIPATNVLSSRFKTNFEEGVPSDPASFRRFLLAIDAPSIALLAEHDEVHVLAWEWINKSLNMRDLVIRYDAESPKPDLVFSRWLPHSNLDEFLALRFPWLEFFYVEGKEYDGEVVEHVMTARVNKIGHAALVLEEFFQNGAAQVPVESTPLIDDEEEDSFDEEAFHRAVDRDNR
jgi:hypothetical protein